MDWLNETFIPAEVRFRTGRPRTAGQRGVRSSSGVRSSAGRTVDVGSSLNAGGSEVQSQVGASLAAWGYVFQVNTQTVAVGANVNFSNNGPLNGISHVPGTAALTVSAAGTYNITFSVYTFQNNPQDWGIVVNGVIQSRFNSAGQTVTGTASLTLNANDRVTIRNVGTVPDPAVLRTGDFTTAYLLMYKVD